MLIFGHRGAAGHAPENTLLSIETALALGADWIEVDVHLVEGRLLVIHDDTLDRTTNGAGPLRRHALSELRCLDAGKGERIPFLEEVLECVAQRAGVNIELKGSATAAPVVDACRRRAGSGWDHGRLLLSSFDWAQLEKARRLAPAAQLGVLTERDVGAALRCAQQLGAWSIHPARRAVTGALVRRAHEAGLRVIPYTVNDPREARTLAGLGADGVFTDYPDRVRSALAPGVGP